MDLYTTASAENPQPPVGGGGRRFTSKQMGDACEMLVAAELTLAGIPALKVPDSWPHYDVIAQPVGAAAQRISVKSRTFKRGAAFVDYKAEDLFDWLAIVILSGEAAAEREVYMVPKAVGWHPTVRLSISWNYGIFIVPVDCVIITALRILTCRSGDESGSSRGSNPKPQPRDFSPPTRRFTTPSISSAISSADPHFVAFAAMRMLLGRSLLSESVQGRGLSTSLG